MEQKLSRSQSMLIVLAVLLVHMSILLSMIITKFDTVSPQATVVFSAEQDLIDHTQDAAHDWVMMSQGSATPPVPKMQQSLAPHAPSQDNSFQESDPIAQEHFIDHAVAIAQKILERTVQEKQSSSSHSTTPPLPSKIAANSPLTLAQLTQGFMQQMQESPMTVKSNQQGDASMEQLQQMHYLQKIIACLVNSYKIHTNSTIQSSPMEQARIQLAIKRDGSIHTLQLVQSSGNVTVDQFLINLFQDASSSFPPLPASLKQDVLYVPPFNVERLESFHSINGWYIDNTIP